MWRFAETCCHVSPRLAGFPAGASRRLAMPMPRGSRPSTAETPRKMSKSPNGTEKPKGNDNLPRQASGRASCARHRRGSRGPNGVATSLHVPRFDGRATWRSQHSNDANLFVFAAYSRLRRGLGLLMSRRLCNGFEWYGLARGRSPYAVTGLGLAVACA